MKKKICKYCYYFVPSSEHGGNCHFNSPFVTETYYDESVIGKADPRGYYIARNTEWPHVYEKDFCGQWKEIFRR